MQVNVQVLQDIYKNVKTIFNKALDGVEPKHKHIATVIPSNTATENYKWLGKLPRLREWIGDRVIQNLTAHEYSIKNKDWEMTIGIDRNDIEDDTIGIYAPLFEEMGHAAAMHPDDIVFPLLHGGFSEKCYDGKSFFNTEHPSGKDGKTKKSNKGTYKLCHEAYNDARVALRSIKGEDDRMIKVNPNLLVVSPQNEAMGKQILEAEKYNDNTNPYRGTAKLLVIEELADNPEEWFLLDTSRPIKPLIFQQRKKPKLVKRDAETDDTVFSKKQFVYGVDSRDNAGYGLWQLAYGSTGASAYPQA